MKFTNFSAVAAILLSSVLSACGGGDDAAGPVVVLNEARSIDEGTQISFSLPAGTYHAEITASNHGVVMNWVGGGTACPTSAEINTYSLTCTLPIAGQFTILNPTLLGLGGSEVVTIKITKE